MEQTKDKSLYWPIGIVLGNSLLVLLYAIGIKFSKDFALSDTLWVSSFVMIWHAGLAFIVGMVSLIAKKPAFGKGFLLSALLLLLIGFSTCFGVVATTPQ